MKNIISIVVTVAIIVAAGMVAGSGCVQKPIRIGAILSLSGAGSYLGADARDGMLLAVDEVNSRGGINGRRIELIIEPHKAED